MKAILQYEMNVTNDKEAFDFLDKVTSKMIYYPQQSIFIIFKQENNPIIVEQEVSSDYIMDTASRFLLIDRGNETVHCSVEVRNK
ncbi:MAG: hypothetical protein ACXACY_27900 [Candidatus Hodarchaeales archaeon]|jgi:hypothetical protein